MGESAPISPATPDEWREAFELALAHVPDGERAARVRNALTLLAAGELEAEGILVARTPAGLAGVQVAVPLRGASGLMWLSRVRTEHADPSLADRLAMAALTWLRGRGAKFAQALTDPRADAAALGRCGFQRVTQLLYLLHDLRDSPADAHPSAWRLEAFAAANEAVFQATLLRTYEATQDCPELNGRRTIAEVLDGHRDQGRWRPELWRLAWVDNEPVGVVLLTELESGTGWDLSYLGVTPEQRGRGWGRRLAVYAVQSAHAAGAARLTVAVDGRNLAALRLYESLGFARVQAKDVHLYFYD